MSARRRRPRELTPFERVRQDLATHWRMWASLPPEVDRIVFQMASDRDGNGTSQPRMDVKRPRFPRGVCAGCGCTHEDPCFDATYDTCAWRDRSQTRCTACPPVAATKKGRRP